MASETALNTVPRQQMKTIPIQITLQEYEWLSGQAEQSGATIAKMIESMIRDAFLYQGEELPPYDWGEGGIPEGSPVKYDPDLGLVVIEDSKK